MKETLTVRPAVREALQRGEEKLRQVRWLFEQGTDADWALWSALQRATWATQGARALAAWEGIGKPAYARHRAKVLSGEYEREENKRRQAAGLKPLPTSPTLGAERVLELQH